MPTEATWEALRAEFPALARYTFLNTATYGQSPRAAYDAVTRHFARRDERASMDFLDWFDEADAVRARLGLLTGCTGDDIAFLPTAGAAISLLLNGIDWRPGDRVVTLTDEFPNHIYAPAVLAGVQLVETPWSGFPDAAAHPRTRVVALSTVSYSTGFRPPLDDIARICRERGILLCVDGTQSLGALTMNLAELQPAIMTVDAYKWMLTPNGLSFAYVSPQVRQWLKPAVVGWRSHWDWRAVDHLHHGPPVFSGKAERYEGGMLAFPLIYALDAVVKLMLALGPRAIEDRVLALSASLREQLRALGAEVTGEQSPIVSARWDDADASDLARQLGQQGIIVSARHGRLRLSAHFYNNLDDIARLGEALARCRGRGSAA